MATEKSGGDDNCAVPFASNTSISASYAKMKPLDSGTLAIQNLRPLQEKRFNDSSKIRYVPLEKLIGSREHKMHSNGKSTEEHQVC